MFKLIPSKKRFKQWSMPSKAGYISFVLGIIGFLIYCIPWCIGKVSSITYPNESKINYWLASGLWNASNDNTEEAKKYFDKILTDSRISPSIKEECALWYLSLANHNENILSKIEIDNCLDKFTLSNDTLSQTKVLLLRLLPMIHDDNGDELALVYNNVSRNNHRYSKQLNVLSLAYSNPAILVENVINTKYNFNSEYEERLFDKSIFQIIANKTKNTELITLSLVISRVNDPFEFEDIYLCDYDPFLNIQYNNLHYRESLQKHADSILRIVDNGFKSIYLNELSEYANSIGSRYFVKDLFFNPDVDDIIHNDKFSSEKRTNLLFNTINNTDGTISLLNIYATVDTTKLNNLLDEKIRNDRPNDYCQSLLAMNDIKGQIISIENKRVLSKVNIVDTLINFRDGLPTLDIISYVGSFIQNDEFYLIVRRGTILSVEIYKVSKDGSCTLIPFAPSMYFNNYRISSLFYNNIRRDLYLEFEKENWTQANATGKIRGDITAEITDSIYIKRIQFRNPAAELFIKTYGDDIKFQAYIINNVKINNKKIIDQGFLDYIKNGYEINYIKTSCDNMFEYILPELMPNISMAVVSFSKDMFSNGSQKYIVLVKRNGQNGIDILNIYKIVNNKKILSITNAN